MLSCSSQAPARLLAQGAIRAVGRPSDQNHGVRSVNCSSPQRAMATTRNRWRIPARR